MEQGIATLARCGLRWGRRFIRVDVAASPETMLSALQTLPERLVVVPTLHQLATNEGDALALFFRLVADGWRVMTSAPIRSARPYGETGWYDEIVPAWERDTWHDWSPFDR